MARRAMAAAVWTVALAALLLPRAEAQLQAYTDNVTGYVAGSALITNAQCREVRALGHADALVETTPAEGRRRFLSPSARARDETEARVVSFVRAPVGRHRDRRAARAEIRVGETDRARRASGARAPVSGRGHARAATTHRTNAKRRRRAAPRSPDHPPRPRSRPDRDPSSSCLHRFDDEKKQKNTFFPRRRFKRRAAKTTYDSNKPARGDG
jgi:hypothetical protein